MTFYIHKIPKEIKIGYQKNKCRTLYPKSLKMLQMSEVWAPSGPIYMTTNMQKMRRI